MGLIEFHVDPLCWQQYRSWKRKPRWMFSGIPTICCLPSTPRSPSSALSHCPGNPCAVTSKEGAAIERDSSAYYLAARAGALSPGCEKDSSVTIFIHLANHRPATFGLRSGTFVGLFGQLITSTRRKERW